MSVSYILAHDRAAKAILDRAADADTVAAQDGDDSYIRAWIAGAETVQSVYEGVFGPGDVARTYTVTTGATWPVWMDGAPAGGEA